MRLKTFLLFIPALFLFSAKGHGQTYFTLDPVLTPDAKTIIFSYNGDLWKVPVSGGEAVRLTAMEGEETRPNVSPDGKWIAFSATQYGNKDIYVMPLEGGDIRQLTWNDAADDVDSWSWDSKTIYFTSGRYNRFSGYKVNIEGSTPVRLFENYFNTVHNVVVHPKTKEIFFNESWESKNFAHRKRYKGDYNPDVKSYNPSTGEFKKYTDYRGKDFGVTIDQNGNWYFMSDEFNGEYNLYTIKDGTKTRLTDFTSSIYWPKVSANGEKIVFRKDYQIFVYDVASGQTTQPPISVYKNFTLGQQQDFNVKGRISAFDVSSDNKKIAFVSRGILFISDIKGKFIKQIVTNSEEAVREVKWLKDNETLLYTRSDHGYYNLFTISAKGEAKARQITKHAQNDRLLCFNSNKTKAVYLSGRNEVTLLDLSSLTSEVIARDELWGMYNAQPYFSPDDKYIMFNAKRYFEDDIFVIDLATRKITNLTHTKVSEDNPYWSPDGKYIYFSSDRVQPSYPYGTRNARIYRMALDKYEDPFTSDKVEELFQKEEKKDESGDDKKKKKEESNNDNEKKEDKVTVSINEVGLMDRLERIGPTFGQQHDVFVIKNGDKTMVFYISNHNEGVSHLWKTTLEPFEEPKTEEVSKDRIFGFDLVMAKDKYYLLTDGNINSFKPADGKLDKINMDFTFRKNLSNEFEQMFYEAWADMETNYYDQNFHGQNWQALRDKYAAYIPYLIDRSSLRMIFNDMLGELNTSHFGFYSNGHEEDTYYGSRTIATGIMWDESNPYSVARIVKDSPADVSGKDIKPGDKLVAIDGVPVDNTKNREMYFSKPSIDPEITLSLMRNGATHDVKLHGTSSGRIRNLLYDEWEDVNQKYVDEKSNNRIAYIHMKNMGSGELNSFLEEMVSEGGYKDGLILDLRYNTGGNVHDDVLRFLSQRPYLQWKYREGKFATQSNFGPAAKPIVLLVNQQSLSDAEVTSAGFKALGLGTIIGTETYRWIIFTSGAGLVDGSFVRLPSWGCYTLDGKDLEANGVTPDIYVGKNFTDRLNGSMPQLDKAIEVILNKLK